MLQRSLPLFVLLIGTVVLTTNACSDAVGESPNAGADDSAPSASASEAAFERIRSRLSAQIGAEPGEIRPTPVDNLFETVIGGQVVYISGDGHYLVTGNLIDIQNRSNLTADREREVRLSRINQLDPQDMIVFGPEQSPKHTLTVFTDVECPYCQRLHEEVDALNEAGIAVRYLLYPRAGLGSQSYKTSVDIWCADDPQKALTEAKQGKAVPDAECDAPIRKIMQVAQTVGMSGTPYMLTDEGQAIPGYRPAEELIKALNGGR
jgi:thiol:disulfide interchange protein DsbC